MREDAFLSASWDFLRRRPAMPNASRPSLGPPLPRGGSTPPISTAGRACEPVKNRSKTRRLLRFASRSARITRTPPQASRVFMCRKGRNARSGDGRATGCDHAGPADRIRRSRAM